MDNKVTLSLKDPDIISLAGYEYGQQIYESQVKGKLDFSKDFYIEIPNNIKFVASSFVQGFFSKIKDEIGLLAIENHAKILSDNSNLSHNFINKL